MRTNISTPVLKSHEAAADKSIRHAELREVPQGDFMHVLRRLVKWFGFLSTMVWAALAFTPGTFNVPLTWRPWCFLTFIFWFVAFWAGMFNL